MERDEFEALFHSHLAEATEDAESRLGRKVPEEITIELHGAGFSGKEMSPSRAAGILFLGRDKFYRVIDISAVRVSAEKTTIFVRVSGHTPGRFEQTWNSPSGSGPFKLLKPVQIEVDE
jgi:hypothetical protein